jgi:hypothetical protein
MEGMNPDPFSAPYSTVEIPDWFILILYAVPAIIWLNASWGRSRRFSLRGLLVFVTAYACLFAILPKPFKSNDHDPADDGWLDEVIRRREIRSGRP